MDGFVVSAAPRRRVRRRVPLVLLVVIPAAIQLIWIMVWFVVRRARHQAELNRQFFAAAERGDARTTRSLLDAGADPNARRQPWEHPEARPYGFRRALERLNPLVEEADDHLVAPVLTLAAAGRHAETVALLLERGANPNAPSGYGWTPLMLASAGGDDGPEQIATVGVLLRHGADVNAQYYGNRYSALMRAAEAGNTSVAAVLLDHGADVNAPDKASWRAGMTALDYALRLPGPAPQREAIVALLRKRGGREGQRMSPLGTEP
jgi:hypothetical protein